MDTPPPKSRRSSIWDRLQYHFKLAGHEAVPCTFDDWLAWASTKPDIRVGADRVGDNSVSTVFLLAVLFHGHPFESLVYEDGEEHTYQYDTWEEAEAGHAAIVARLREKNHG